MRKVPMGAVYERTPVMPFREEDIAPPPQYPVKKEVREPKRPSAHFFLRNKDSKVQFFGDPVPGLGVALNSDNPLQLFVALVTVRLLKECNAIKDRARDQWVAHSKRLIDQTMIGLVLTDGYCPENKNARAMCKSVIKQLQKDFCTKQQLDALVGMEHPAVDAVIVQCMQAHIRELSADLAGGVTKGRNFWKWVLLALTVIAAAGAGVGVGVAHVVGLL